MGCGSSKITTPVIEDGIVLPETSESPQIREVDNPISPDHSSKNITPPTIPKLNGAAPQLQPQLRAIKSPESVKPPPGPREAIAFELSTSGDNSLIKKHPPRKFHKLEEQQTGPSLTQEQLEMKQHEAQGRRQELISKRVQSAKQRTARSAHARSVRSTHTGEMNEIDGGVIESPDNDGT